MELLRGLGRWVLIHLGLVLNPDFVVRKVPDHPLAEAMKPGWLYVVGGRGYAKWACFRCPGNDTEIIQLSLMTNRRPSWRVSIDILGRPTLDPSVRQLEGSFAHFWVKGGRVEWCADSGKEVFASAVSHHPPAHSQRRVVDL